MIEIGKYDLIDWRWEEAFISPKKYYLLEENLEKRYIAQFGKSFEMK